MGNINTLLVHRINYNKTTDYISKWVAKIKHKITKQPLVVYTMMI